MTRADILKFFPNASQEFILQNIDQPPTPIPAKKTIPRAVSAPIKGDSDLRPCTSIQFTIPLPPMGKPRMTQRDRWYKDPNHPEPKKRQRACVSKYENWKTLAAPYIPPNLPDNPKTVSWVAYFPFPKSYGKIKRALLSGTFHREKPDRDNVDKLICDFLFKQDKGICEGTLKKLWDDGKGARIEIEVIQ